MNKYLSLFSLSWQNGLVYRTSLLLWRFRQFLTTIMSLTVWTALFQNQESAFGYSSETMITYVFVVAILQNTILTTALQGLSNTIYSGNLTHELLKPVNVYYYLLTQDLSDKIKNVFFVIIETVILLAIFQPVINFPNVLNGLIFMLFVFGGVAIHFLIQLLFGAIGFWSPETWGPRFLFYMIVEFTAGRLFPLDILPNAIQKIVYFTPFPFLSFIQSQIFLQKFSNEQILQSTISLCLWLILLSFTVQHLWRKGIKDYEATGR